VIGDVLQVSLLPLLFPPLSGIAPFRLSSAYGGRHGGRTILRPGHCGPVRFGSGLGSAEAPWNDHRERVYELSGQSRALR